MHSCDSFSEVLANKLPNKLPQTPMLAFFGNKFAAWQIPNHQSQQNLRNSKARKYPD